MTACGGGDDSTPFKLDLVTGNSLTYSNATTAIAGELPIITNSAATRTVSSVRADGDYELVITSNTNKEGRASLTADHFIWF